MKKRKLKGFVLPTVYVMTMAALFLGISFFASNLMEKNENYLFSLNPVTDTTIQVVSTEPEAKVIEPIKENTAEKINYFYDREADNATQQKSLIYYENTYMQNTGILYAADETFDVISVLDGTIKEIKNDNILGNVIEIEHTNNLRTIYYSLSEVTLKVGDNVTQGQIIGLSGQSKLETGKANNLLFEVYQNGNLLNPEKFYEMNPSEFEN